VIRCAHLPLATPQNVYFARRTLLQEWKLPHNPFHLIGCLLEVWVTCDQNHRSVSKEECDRLTWWTGALGRVVRLNNGGAPSTGELKPSCGHVGWTPRPSRYELAAPPPSTVVVISGERTVKVSRCYRVAIFTQWQSRCLIKHDPMYQTTILNAPAAGRPASYAPLQLRSPIEELKPQISTPMYRRGAEAQACYRSRTSMSFQAGVERDGVGS
jgi:hypothetical protein